MTGEISDTLVIGDTTLVRFSGHMYIGRRGPLLLTAWLADRAEDRATVQFEVEVGEPRRTSLTLAWGRADTFEEAMARGTEEMRTAILRVMDVGPALLRGDG